MPGSLTIPADATANLHGFNAGTFRIPVTNSGTVALRVSGSVAAITPKAKAHGAVRWVTIGTAQQTIQPGHQGVLVVVVHVPAAAGLSGARYVNVLARAEPVSHSGQVQEAGGVGGTLRILHAGHRSPPAPVVPPGHSGFPAAILVALGVALVLALVAVVLARRWFGRPGAHA